MNASKNQKKKKRKLARLLESNGLAALPKDEPASSSSSSPPAPLSSVALAATNHSSAEHGTHFKQKEHKTNINDEWQTASEGWSEVAPMLEDFKKKRIWMPFYYDGVCKKHVKQLGFRDVVHEDKDFFERVKDQTFMKNVALVWDNPPYTGVGIKEKIFQALVTAGVPFILLLPSSVMFSKFVRDCLDMTLVQLVVPRRVLVRKTGHDAVPFKHLVWFCYRTKLKRDVMFA